MAGIRRTAVTSVIVALVLLGSTGVTTAVPRDARAMDAGFAPLGSVSLSGKVTHGSGAPVDAALVTVWHAGGGLADIVSTEPDGSWEVMGLASGSYKIRAGDFGTDHEWAYYGGDDWHSATAVTYSGTEVGGLDITVPSFPSVKRLAGLDRYRTGTAVSEDALVLPNGRVYIASGTAFPDALAGGPGILPGSPILLVDPNSVPSTVFGEIERLDPDEIVILGGEGAVSASVAAALASHAPVSRLAGSDRFGTAVAISQDGFPDPSKVDTVFLANGLDFPDALAGGAAAGLVGAPILLTTDVALPTASRNELIRLDPSEIVVLGGTGAVAKSVADAAGAAVPGATVRRLAGADRFATAAVVSQNTFFDAETVYVANGLDFPDALAGAPAAILDFAPLLLVTTDSIPAATRAEIQRLGPDQIVILGGPAVVSDAVAAALAGLVAP